MANYNINRDVSDNNPLPTKVVNGANGEPQETIERPLNLVEADFFEVQPSTEKTFDPQGSMFNLRNPSATTDVFFGFTPNRMDRNVILMPKNTSRIYNDQGTVYLWHNGPDTVKVYFQRFEVMDNA